ncbi:MAG: helix-turn-helix domain-containing protein [Saprospiraceae bacterium]
MKYIDAFGKAKEYADKTLLLKDQLPEVYFALGAICFWYEWDFEAAFEYLEKALIINPSHSYAVLTIETDNKKEKKPLLDKATNEAFSKKLLDLITTKEPYLDSNLTLKKLANLIGIHPNQLSWLLNQYFGKSFNDFINHYRVEAFKQIAIDPKSAHITLIGLAYESGFNSKTVFNTFFKKETGMTPKQYVSRVFKPD